MENTVLTEDDPEVILAGIAGFVNRVVGLNSRLSEESLELITQMEKSIARLRKDIEMRNLAGVYIYNTITNHMFTGEAVNRFWEYAILHVSKELENKEKREGL